MIEVIAETKHLENHIHPTTRIEAEHVEIGVGVHIGANVHIKAQHVVIGDFVSIGDGCKFYVPEFRIGDYSRVGDLALGVGTKPMVLGRNLYIGRLVRLDSRGGLTIEDNVGIGDSSQIWTHIRWGDPVQGCRWDKEYPLVIERDAWLVAKVTVGGCQRIGARAMIFNESNVTKREIPADTSWRGNPACDVTEVVGRQFEELSAHERYARLWAQIVEFENAHPEHIGMLVAVLPNNHVPSTPHGIPYNATFFHARERVYTKHCTAAEVAFLRWTLAKFTPIGEE